jgi:hypothetical protein
MSSTTWLKCQAENTCGCNTIPCNGCPGPKGKNGVSVVGTYIHDGFLYLQLSNGQRLQAGECVGPMGPEGKQGVSVTHAFIENGYLILILSDSTQINAGYCMPQKEPIEFALNVQLTPNSNVYSITMSRSVMKTATGTAVLNFMVLPDLATTESKFTFQWEKQSIETPGELNWFIQCAESSSIKAKLIKERTFEVTFMPTSVGHHRVCFTAQ